MGTFSSKEFQFSDTKVNLLGLQLTGLRGLTYDFEEDSEFVYGQGSKAKSIQSGNEKVTGVLKVLKSDADALNAAAVAAGYKNLVKVPYKFNVITCVYENDEGALQTVTIARVKFSKMPDGFGSQTDKFKEMELPFMALDLTVAY